MFKIVSHLRIEHLIPLWPDEVEDALGGSFEGDSSYEQRDEHHVREYGREVGYFARGGDSFDQH